MVFVLLGCVGLTAGVALGTLFSSNQSRASVHSQGFPAQSSCHQDWRWHSPSDLANTVGGQPPPPSLQGVAHDGGCAVFLPLRISDSAPSGGLPMGDYVLFGLLGGLSAALGFLVPPRSRLTGVR
jgi:hypothetical protein